MWFYYLIYLLVVFVFLVGIRYKVVNPLYYLCLIALALIAGFRPQTCCADYTNYIDYFNNVDNISFIQLEPSFFVISKIAKFVFGGSLGVFIIYSFLGVFSKGVAIKKLTEFYTLSLAIYVSTYFLLHEMTQIRVGVASSVLLFALPSIQQKKPYQFLFLIALGTLFHYSFLIFIIFYFLSPSKINPLFYICLIVFGFFAYFINLNLISLVQHIPISFISDKIGIYNTLMDMGVNTKINVFNVLVIFRIALLFIFLWKWRLLHERNKYSLILIKIYAFSIFSFIFLAGLPVLAFRVRDLLGIVEIILFPFLIYLFREKYVAFIIIVLLGLTLMSIDLWYNPIISSYF